MSPIQWALLPLKKYAQFSGRAPRAEFWWFFLFLVIVYAALAIVGGMVGGAAAVDDPTNPLSGLVGFGVMGILMILFWLAVLIPTTAVQVRRLHDTNRSGWWVGIFWLIYLLYMVMAFASIGSPDSIGGGIVITMILGLVMFIYSIVLLVFQCLPGTRGPNDYGPDPYGYGDDVGEVFA